MPARKEDLLTVRLETGSVNRSFANHLLGEGDSEGDVFGVLLYKDNQPVSLTGMSCIGYFIRADNNTVVLDGDVSGNKAYITLPQTCYAVEGNFQLTIKVTDGNVSTTVRIVDGTVIEAMLGGVIDPGGLIPDLSVYTALVERIEAAAEVIDGISITSTQIQGTRYKINVATS